MVYGFLLMCIGLVVGVGCLIRLHVYDLRLTEAFGMLMGGVSFVYGLIHVLR